MGIGLWFLVHRALSGWQFYLKFFNISISYKKRNYIYILPDLEQCRLAFDKARNTKTNWEGV